MSSLKEKLEGGLNDVEHSLSLFADSYCTLPAELIYDKNRLKEYEEIIKKCHIYMIGYLPTKELISASQKDQTISMQFKIADKEKNLEIQIPQGLKLVEQDDIGYFLENEGGEKYTLPKDRINSSLSKYVNFDVRYIGQAYGTDGSRNAIDRLLKHETLQKISLTAVPEGCVLSLLLLGMDSNNRIITMLNPYATNEDDGSRIDAGVDKLCNTSELERISLFEASLIRYFSPQFNKEFKNSFPSTNLKLLQDCYDKDFSTILAEICIDGLPFRLFSESIEPKYQHFVKHDLHKEKDRNVFFYDL
jgi:hypothetical protein